MTGQKAQKAPKPPSKVGKRAALAQKAPKKRQKQSSIVKEESDEEDDGVLDQELFEEAEAIVEQMESQGMDRLPDNPEEQDRTGRFETAKKAPLLKSAAARAQAKADAK